MLSDIVSSIVNAVSSFGYFGIFVMMFLESTVVPIPSEIVMIPAGYLAANGEMNIYIVLFMGIFGSLAGAVFNYYLALKYGRPFLSKYGKYIFFNEQTQKKIDDFFLKHGHISTFSGRLIPGVRHLISIPAGLAKMNFFKFTFYTTLGAGIWVTILTLLGYFIGQNQELIHKYLALTLNSVLILLALYIAFQIYKKFKKN